MMVSSLHPNSHSRGSPHSQKAAEHQRHRDQAGEAVAHDLLRRLVVALAHGDGRPGRAALGHKVGKGGNEVGHREAQAHAGQGHCPNIRHVADVDPVYNII